MSNRVLAIIPARKGSRGVPGKNFRDLSGKPVIAYSILAAQAARLVDKIVVSSDADEARQISADYQVKFLERPGELGSDSARIDDVMRQVVRELEEKDSYRPDAVALLYANVPVRAEGVIDRAVEMLFASGADSVQTLADVGKYHPYWLYQIEDGQMNKYIDNEIFRRQDLPPLYAIDGAVGVVRTECLMAAKGAGNPHAFWGKKRQGLIQDASETVDIDSPRDFRMAEAVLEIRKSANS